MFPADVLISQLATFDDRTVNPLLIIIGHYHQWFTILTSINHFLTTINHYQPLLTINHYQPLLTINHY